MHVYNTYMVKRKSLGFKGGKQLVVYIGKSSKGNVSKHIIDISRNTWNTVEVNWLQSAKKKVKQINFEFRSQSCKWAGTWYNQTQTLKIYDNTLSSTSYFRCVIIHELAHAWYWNEYKINEERIQAFAETVNKLDAVNKYTRDNRESWGHWLYANEIHSALTEYLYADRELELGSAQNLNALLEAYNTLHA